jgi:hypothetical protein
MISAYVYQDSTLTNNLPIILYSLFRERALSLSLSMHRRGCSWQLPVMLLRCGATMVAAAALADGGAN